MCLDYSFWDKMIFPSQKNFWDVIIGTPVGTVSIRPERPLGTETEFVVVGQGRSFGTETIVVVGQDTTKSCETLWFLARIILFFPIDSRWSGSNVEHPYNLYTLHYFKRMQIIGNN